MNDKLYMVVLYIDGLPHHEYGVNDNYYLIGIFDDKNLAELVKQNEEIKMENADYCVGFEVEVKEVSINKVYKSDEFYLGGGFYIE